MATSKTFTVAGVSTLGGKTKIRFANDVMRIKILDKNDHQNIELVDLPTAMSKGEIAVYLKESGFCADRPEVVEAIQYVARKNPVASNNKEQATEVPAATAELESA
jgi:hypothetical protein